MKRNLKKLMAFLLAAIMLIAFPVMAFADDEEVAEFDPNGVYHARLGIQAKTSDGITWMQRLGYYHDDDGNVVCTGTEGEDGYVAYDSTFTDAVIEGNGTYSVILNSTDLGQAATFTQLQVSTDIPMNDTVKFTNLKVEINGLTAANYSDVYVDKDAVAGPYMCLVAYNDWRSDLLAQSDCMAADDAIPTDGDIEIKLTFTVSGFANDAPTEAPTEAATDAPASDSSSSSSESSSSSLSTGAIIGIVAGVVVVIIIIIVVAANASKKKKN